MLRQFDPLLKSLLTKGVTSAYHTFESGSMFCTKMFCTTQKRQIICSNWCQVAVDLWCYTPYHVWGIWDTISQAGVPVVLACNVQ